MDIEVLLETHAGGRRRIDIEAGLTVIEVKKDLRVGRVVDDALVQLAGYVKARTEVVRQRYVGILTDGADWRLYNLGEDGKLHEVANHQVNPSEPDVEALLKVVS
ncbi:hypothetical protein [Carbonactinospora thermoautotrophica]|uniref:hypothetical protein n=1 Tax=Carbonactinospora thermoautotrophica TaxID=1469144 RepID=UPI0018E38781|nr:hypothetical protein [Carbonactinospora thermoautotrophica]